MSRITRLLLASAVLAGLALPAAAENTLRWGASRDIGSLDPYSYGDSFTLGVLNHVYEGLVRYNRDLKIEPALATSWEIVSSTTWRFSLRQGVKFHDGQDFTAEDVQASLVRATDPKSPLRGNIPAYKASRVIGFASVLPGEGKSTTASNFAALLAASGRRTLLIDADMRNPGLSRALLRPPETGLVDVLAGTTAWHGALLQDKYTQTILLPSVLRRNFTPTAELLAGAESATLIREAREHFDYIVVDLPPLGALLDARAFEPICDAFIIVAEWGRTPRELLRSALESHREIGSKAAGVILTKTDMQKLGLYGSVAGPEQYAGHYGAYYNDKS